ncbi:ADP-ribose glycohydrolase ARH3 [Clonorchis sinensis]|uniref:ADP-ribosylhydrolase ARH3 n=2 Tax=Clonorchis sinensis TaxID=79923 RepID=A0A8T1MGY9_CLOSI|nr:ADP-ribose glycohydrolase ARH3 [Clonorchis sinensis]
MIQSIKKCAAMDVRNFVRGVISGGLIGDCYGYVYEDRPVVKFDVPLKLITDTLSGADRSQLIYTDDTQMGLATLRSLRSTHELDPSHLAREYAEDYFKDGSHRYYGGTVPSVFRENARNNYENPFAYAATLFKGSGSYGNGGAMRISPLALYGLKVSETEFDKLVIDVTRLTHTNPLAVCGALLQAHAVRLVWSIVSKSVGAGQLFPSQFLDQLLTRLRAVHHEFVNWNDPKWEDAIARYRQKFESIKSLLVPSLNPPVDKVVESLGHDLKAINSVPLSIFAFLRSLRPIEGIPLESIPLRCMVYTIGLGGDTDSNACMACSLAGGYVGLEPWQTCTDSPIPHEILARCERLSVVNEMIDWLGSRLAEQDRSSQ